MVVVVVVVVVVAATIISHCIYTSTNISKSCMVGASELAQTAPRRMVRAELAMIAGEPGKEAKPAAALAPSWARS